MQGTGNINTAIASNRNLYAATSTFSLQDNKRYLANSYTTDKIQYYNDELALQKEKKKKRNKILTLAFTGIAGLGIAGTLAIEIIKGKIKPKLIADQFSNSPIGKKTKDVLQKVVNGSVNFSNIKDDLWTRYTDKSKIMKKINGSLEGVYHGFAKNKYKGNYDKNYNIIKNGLGEIKGIRDFDGWFDDMLGGIRKNLGLDGNGKRVTEGLLDGVKSKKKGALKDLGSKLTDDVLSEQKLSGLRKLQTKAFYIDGIGEISEDLYSKDEQVAKKAFDKLVSKIKASGKLKPEANAEEVATAIKNLNQIKTKGGNDLFERIRDTALGNASTDTLGVLLALGTLGGSLATSENKVERKSTMINLGIPLLVTLGGMVYGTAMCYSGGVALAFSFITGQIAKVGAKFIDNKTKQHALLKAENDKKEYVA